MKPYLAQLDAVAAALKAGSGTVVLPTGAGKSVCMALLVNALQLRTLIVVPNLGLKHQLTESFNRWFGVTQNITILNIDSPKLDKETNYDVLIVDEAHHSAAATFRRLNAKAWGGIYHRFFFTATPFRSQQEEQILLESIAGEVVYSLSHAKAVESGHIVPMDAYYLRVPKKECDSNNWQVVYKSLVVNNLPRNESIAKLLGNLDASGASTLCLVKEVAHGEALRDLTGLPFAHGEAEDAAHLIREFSSGRLKTLIATTGVCGEGVDTRAAEYIVIAGLGKSRPALMQQFGRGFRRFGDKESCKVILFKDQSHKFTVSHFREQVKTLREEYGVEPSELG